MTKFKNILIQNQSLHTAPLGEGDSNFVEMKSHTYFQGEIMKIH